MIVEELLSRSVWVPLIPVAGRLCVVQYDNNMWFAGLIEGFVNRGSCPAN